MRFFEEPWTPETADAWTVHDLVAALVSPLVFFMAAAGTAWVAVGDARGWFLLAAAVGGCLLLWATIDRKLRAQSDAFRKREAAHEALLEQRQRWRD